MVTPAPRVSGSSRLRVVDRIWTATEVAVVVGPVAVPSLEELRRAAALVAHAPWPLHLSDALDLAAGRWVHLELSDEELGERLVREHVGPGVEEAGLQAVVAQAMAARPVDQPVQWTAAGDHLVLSVNHAVGDASSNVPLVTCLFEAARTGAVPAGLARTPVRHALRSALRHHYGRSARRVLETARAVRPAPGAAGPVAERRVPSTPGFVHAAVPPATYAALRRWRATNAKGASLVAVQLAVVRQALREAGTAVGGPPYLLFDGRRYLPDGEVAAGNLVVGLDLGVDDDWDLQAVTAAVTATAESGRPLSAMGAGSVLGAVHRARGRLRGGTGTGEVRPAEVSVPVGDVQVQLTCSSVGRQSLLESLPWLHPAPGRSVVPVSSSAPTGVVAALTDLSGSLQVCLSFREAVVDAEAVRAAVQAVVADPVGLVERHVARSGLGAAPPAA